MGNGKRQDGLESPGLLVTAPDEPGSIRRAEASDLESLLGLEAQSFPGDRMSRASFRTLLGQKSALMLVAEDAARMGLLGYCLVLFRRGAHVARLYSIAVDARARGKGVAQRLMNTAEEAALDRGARAMRLEVREDNAAAIRLYEARGYWPIGRREDYYEDHAAALRFEKALLPPPPRMVLSAHGAVPYHPQTTEFTCGPATLMMALAALTPEAVTPGAALELTLWREATCVYLITAPGGCDPIGLALAAERRGVRATVHVNQPGPYFVDITRGSAARFIMSTAQTLFHEEAVRTGLAVVPHALSIAELAAALDRGALVIVLISPWLLLRSTVPHWVLAVARTERAIIIHDPYHDDALPPAPKKRRPAAAVPAPGGSLAIPFHDFERMSVWGKHRLRAAIVLEQKTPS